MAYYLGLDAGGTKTECAVAQDDAVLAHTTGGSIKILRVSTEDAARNLDTLFNTVSAQSGIPLNAITCTCIGLAGSSMPRIADWIRQALHARVSGDLLMAGDEEIALDAAFRGGAGVLVVAGTGSNIIGRSVTGHLFHVGGWGPVIADEGSGIWIGKQAIRAIFDAQDHGETTLLLQKMLDHWGLRGIGDLIDLVNQLPGPDFSKLPPLVAECAEENDPYASRVLEGAGNALGLYAVLAAQRMRMDQPEHFTQPEFAFTGSILRRLAPVRAAMFAAIRHDFPEARIQAEAVDPVQGALWRARQCSTRLDAHTMFPKP
jgi:glucosamine kinase